MTSWGRRRPLIDQHGPLSLRPAAPLPDHALPYRVDVLLRVLVDPVRALPPFVLGGAIHVPLPPRHVHPQALALVGVRPQALAVTLARGTVAHVRYARLVVFAVVQLRVAAVEALGVGEKPAGEK